MEFDGEVARKSGNPRLLRVEAEKSRRAGQIGRSSGLFRVPRVLGLNESEGTLEFEREPNLVTFNQFVGIDLEASQEVVRRAGRAIARVHNELQLDASMQRLLPEPWIGEDDENVSLHGDFTAHNLCIDRETRGLVIVDWSAAPVIGREATVGPRCFDLLCFVRHLILSAPWRQTHSWPAAALSEHFMSGYVDEFGAALPKASWDRQQALLIDFAERAVDVRIQKAPFAIRIGKRFLQNRLLNEFRRYKPPARTLR